jgi:hypothetical protein
MAEDIIERLLASIDRDPWEPGRAALLREYVRKFGEMPQFYHPPASEEELIAEAIKTGITTGKLCSSGRPADASS